jgi:hypothetical protein
MRWRLAVFAGMATLIGYYDLWAVRAAGYPFDWHNKQSNAYYNLLGRAFTQGHLHVPITPLPALLAQPNPWDPAVDDSLKMHDMALYKGRYFLYHGAGPAALLFAPWRLITGRDLPENFALFLFGFGGYLFSAGALWRLGELTRTEPPPALFALMLLALGTCQCLPYLLSRVWVYEIAIGGGYFAIAAAVFALTMALESRWTGAWLTASGLMFGLAIACRPHLGLVGIIAIVAFKAFGHKVRPLLISFLAVAGAVALYNYLRFDSPFEFGIRYLITGPNQNRIRLTAANVPVGLYYMLFCLPDFSRVFPWIHLAYRPPFNSSDYPWPDQYFLEPTAGALTIAPFLIGATWIFWSRNLTARVRLMLSILLLSSGAILLFLAATGFTTQRYEVDFVPLATLAVIAGWGTTRRTALQMALAAAIVYSSMANLALGISGPYDELLRNRPDRFVRIASWFSPASHFRPILNPGFDLRLRTEFRLQDSGFREPLVTIGRQPYRHFLYAEHLPGRIRIVSRSDKSSMSHEIDFALGRTFDIHVSYTPGPGILTTTIDGGTILEDRIGAVVAAPVQITVGENRIDDSVTAPQFTGRIEIRSEP